MKTFTVLIISVFTGLAYATPIQPSLWMPAAEKVCTQIQTAVDFYQKKDIKQAKLAALMAYFKGYDAEIEPAVRITLGGPHVFSIERKFRNFASLITEKTQTKIILESASSLCQDVKADALALDKENVPLQVFNVD